MTRGRPAGFDPVASAEQRFLSGRVLKSSGCIEWPGAKDHGGYARFRVCGRKEFVHRYAYERVQDLQSRSG